MSNLNREINFTAKKSPFLFWLINSFIFCLLFILCQKTYAQIEFYKKSKLSGSNNYLYILNSSGHNAISSSGEKIFALVIDEFDYLYQEKLPVTNDGKNPGALTYALLRKGFDVAELVNVTRISLDTILPALKKYFQNKNYNIALCFFNGHGATYNGVQFLGTIEDNGPEKITSLTDLQVTDYLKNKTLLVEQLMQTFNLPQTRYCLSIIDACRNEYLDNLKGDIYSNELRIMQKEQISMQGKGALFFSTRPGNSSFISGYGNGDKNLTNLSFFTAGFIKLLNSYEEGNPINMCRIIANRIPCEEAEYFPPGNKYNFNFFGAETTPQVVQKIPEKAQAVLDIMIEVTSKSWPFLLGNDDIKYLSTNKDEGPVHSVTLDPYSISMFEISVDKFEVFIKDSHYITDAEKSGYSYIYNGNSWEKKAGINWRHNLQGTQWAEGQKRNHAVVHVSWNDACAFCAWLTKITDKIFRLPTEAEWEAATGWEPNSKQRTIYCGSNYIELVANYNGSHNTDFGSIGTKRPYEELYDMSGNVWEWCLDTYDAGYYSELNNGRVDNLNPKGPQRDGQKVIRGGSALNDASRCRVTARSFNNKEYCDGSGGFRVVMLEKK